MAYSSVEEVVLELAEFMDETDAQTYTIPDSRKRRLGHYVQRAYDDIWHYRPWPFKFGEEFNVTFNAAGADGGSYASLPNDFGNVGPEGLFYKLDDSDKSPWVETSIQDMKAVNASGRHKHKKWFAIGYGSDPSTLFRIYIPQTSVPNGPFYLFYEKAPIKYNLGGLGIQEVGLPPVLHPTLWAGSVAKLQQAKGDPQSIWRAEYVASLAKATAVLLPNASRMQQLPNTVGGQW